MTDNAGYGIFMEILDDRNIVFNPEQVIRYLNTSCDTGITVNMTVACEAAQTQEWTTPAGDGAWWYVANRPASGEFLGVIITDLKGMDSTLKRSPVVRETGFGGGTLGNVSSAGRRLTFEALMFAETCRGMEYGKRALIDALRGADCADWGCPLPEIELWTCCPGIIEDVVDPAPRWLLKSVGLVDGPSELEPPLDTRKCSIARIQFVLESESPWLYKETGETVTENIFTGDPEVCLDVCDWIWNEIGVCLPLIAGSVGEELGIIKIESGDSKFSGTVKINNYTGPETEGFVHDDPAPTVGVGSLISTFQIFELPPNKGLVIDGEQQRIFLLNADGTVVGDGSRFVEVIPGYPFKYPAANARCGDILVCVQSTPGLVDTAASITISSVHREL